MLHCAHPPEAVEPSPQLVGSVKVVAEGTAVTGTLETSKQPSDMALTLTIVPTVMPWSFQVV
jgi:hypothetical protein